MNISYLITFFGVKANGCSLLKQIFNTIQYGRDRRAFKIIPYEVSNERELN